MIASSRPQGVPAAMRPVCAAQAPCKCCGQPAPLFGVVDFHRSCEDRRQSGLFPVSGVPVYYYRCPACGFLFCTAFDGFTTEEMAEFVYNDGYHRADPDFADSRPRNTAELVSTVFAEHRSLSILDYGGGNGQVERLLRERGFSDVTTYDPFSDAYTRKPDRRFQLVICVEVVEHCPDPKATFADIASLVTAEGLVYFTTLVQPQDVERTGTSWWYVAPRNGHVSLHTRESLGHVTRPLGFTFGSFNDNMHALFRREVPPFARHWIHV